MSCQDDVVKEIDNLLDDVDTTKIDSIQPFSEGYTGYWYNMRAVSNTEVDSSDRSWEIIYSNYGDSVLYKESIREDTTNFNRVTIESTGLLLNTYPDGGLSFFGETIPDIYITDNDTLLNGIFGEGEFSYHNPDFNPEWGQDIYVLDTVDNVPNFKRIVSYINGLGDHITYTQNFVIEELTDSTMHLSYSQIQACHYADGSYHPSCVIYNFDMYYLKSRGE